MRNANNQGFTLIELVVVIVILGILAAVAVPRFIDLSSEANVSVLQGLEGAMQSAGVIVFAKAATQRQQDAPLAFVDTDGDGLGDIEAEFGYPSDSRSEGMTLALGSGFAASWAWSTRNGPRRIVVAPAGKSLSGAGQKVNNVPITTNNCYLTYIAPTEVGGAPTISLTTTGC